MNYKNLSVDEKVVIRGLLKEQVENGFLNKPMDFNVKIYLEAVKVAILADCPDGIDDTFSGEKIDVSIIPAVELSKKHHYTDHRSFWHSDYGDEKYKWLYWYAGLTNKKKFKEWVLNAHPGGHPWECRTGIISPQLDELSGKFYLHLHPDYHSNPLFQARAFIALAKSGFPVQLGIKGTHGTMIKTINKRYIPNKLLQGSQ
jgi:hypothetical protein